MNTALLLRRRLTFSFTTGSDRARWTAPGLPPITLRLPGHGHIMLGRHDMRGRLRCRRGRLRSGLRLLPALEALEPPELLHVRHEVGVRRIARQARADDVRLGSDEGDALAANEIRSGDAIECRPQLILRRRPAVALIDQLAHAPRAVPHRLPCHP